jgi:hypothetical protein
MIAVALIALTALMRRWMPTRCTPLILNPLMTVATTATKMEDDDDCLQDYNALLHNFIIEEDGPFGTERFASVSEEMQSMNISPHSSAPLGMSYLPVVPDDALRQYLVFTMHSGLAIVEHLCEHEIGRPAHNIQRRKEEMEAERAAAERDGRRLIECDREYVSP